MSLRQRLLAQAPFVAFPVRLFLFWWLFFTLFRAWFILWSPAKWPADNPWSLATALWASFPLDASTAGYLVAIPILAWLAGLAAGAQAYIFTEKFINIFNYVLIIVLIGLFGANIFIYDEWNTPLNNRAIEYMSTPYTLFASMSPLFIAACVGLYVTAFVLLRWLYLKIMGRRFFPEKTQRSGLIWLFIHIPVLLLAIRGGAGVMPVNESAVYYSANSFSNHAAVNPFWHLMHSMLESRSETNHFTFMDPDVAERTRKALFSTPDTLPVVIPKADTPPNVVFLVMESMTAQVIGALGGEPGICPNMDSLIHGGILFNRCYSSGYRTDQGLVAILAGYPAQPDQSIVLLSDKAQTLPTVTATLSKQGYTSLFCYGGELTFANIGVWLHAQGFQHIFSVNDFPRAAVTQRWGVDDATMLARYLSEINQLKQPFFATALTLSLHPPFDVPGYQPAPGTPDRDKFLASAAFVDRAIGQFIQDARKQPWFDNTIFVLVADHGNALPNGYTMDNPKARHVPLVWWGKPLASAWEGATIQSICNHQDIPALLLSALGFDHQTFDWSRAQWPTGDKQSAANTFAYYTNENGLGWITPEQQSFMTFQDKAWHDWQGKSTPAHAEQAKAFLQSLYEDFVRR